MTGNEKSRQIDGTFLINSFGDVDPLAIAQANNLSVDSVLYIVQQLTIP
jgi:hypothetical protein